MISYQATTKVTIVGQPDEEVAVTLSDDIVVTAATTLAKRLSMSIKDYIELVGITEGQKIKLDGNGKHTFYLTSKGVMDENGFAVKAGVIEVKF